MADFKKIKKTTLFIIAVNVLTALGAILIFYNSVAHNPASLGPLVYGFIISLPVCLISTLLLVPRQGFLFTLMYVVIASTIHFFLSGWYWATFVPFAVGLLIGLGLAQLPRKNSARHKKVTTKS